MDFSRGHMNKIEIAGKEIGEDFEPFIISEIEINHGASYPSL